MEEAVLGSFSRLTRTLIKAGKGALTVEMLKMKVDPAICMKTNTKRQNVSMKKGPFCTNVHQLRGN